MIKVEVVQAKAMGSSMVKVDSDAIAKALENNGKTVFENIYFDTVNATLKPESGDAIAQIAKALAAHDDLKVEIERHTDHTGAPATNPASRSRAALIARRISTSRLTAKEISQTKPVTDDGNDADRAKNRRVELVQQ